MAKMNGEQRMKTSGRINPKFKYLIKNLFVSAGLILYPIAHFALRSSLYVPRFTNLLYR